MDPRPVEQKSTQEMGRIGIDAGDGVSLFCCFCFPRKQKQQNEKVNRLGVIGKRLSTLKENKHGKV